jgi:hypothetical protein
MQSKEAADSDDTAPLSTLIEPAAKSKHARRSSRKH